MERGNGNSLLAALKRLGIWALLNVKSGNVASSPDGRRRNEEMGNPRLAAGVGRLALHLGRNEEKLPAAAAPAGEMQKWGILAWLRGWNGWLLSLLSLLSA